MKSPWDSQALAVGDRPGVGSAVARDSGGRSVDTGTVVAGFARAESMDTCYVVAGFHWGQARGCQRLRMATGRLTPDARGLLDASKRPARSPYFCFSRSRRRRQSLGGTDGLLEHAFANSGFQCRARHETDAPAQERAKPLLQADEVEEPDGLRKVDDQVDVGILTRLASHDGAEQEQRADAVGLPLRPRPLQG
jgi:hypothetical protein